jgi:probable F420-dependent oxidoreductase
VRVGVWLPCYKAWIDRDAVLTIATATEELGFGSLWVQDHVVAPVDDRPVDLLPDWLEPDDYGGGRFTAVEYYGEEDWWLDPYALWGFLAGVTTTCELGSGVVVLPYRNPIVQAKMLGTLDVLSGGRMLFGVGVGHVPSEFEVLGVDYRRRGHLTDEYLRVITALLTEDETGFDGETIRFGKVRPLIRPIQSPRPPFLIGGTSKRSIRRAVELGDGWLPAHVTPEKLAPGIQYLRALAAEHDREPPGVSVVLTWGLTAQGSQPPTRSRRRFHTVGEAADLLAAYAALGCERLAIDLPNPNLGILLDQMELLARAVDRWESTDE